jgi:Protein of unknown function (DUF726)
MSGVKMMKRTRAIEEFEFIGIYEALELIRLHKEERKKIRESKNKTLQISDEKRESMGEDEYQRQQEALANMSPYEYDGSQSESVLWDAGSDTSDAASTPKAKQEDEDEVVKPTKQTHVLITITGFVTHDRDDHTYPYSTLEEGGNGDQYTLIWETAILKELGETLGILLGEVASFIFQQGLQLTVLPALMAALTAPMWAIKLTYLVDNPWGNALTKAEKAGRLLADTLIGQVQSNRPVTLVGFSLGARVIYCCLLELAAKGAYGLVEEVYLMGTPVLSSKKEWENVISVVSGRFVNGYCPSDTLLSILYRANAAVMWKEVAGLCPTPNPHVENINLEGTVAGHLDYYSKLPSILEIMGFATTGDKFYDQTYEEEEYKKQQQKKNPLKPKAVDPKVAEQEVNDEMKQMFELDDLMKEYWAPRELVSTLPPLILAKAENDVAVGEMDAKLDDLRFADLGEEEFIPKELPSSLPPLVIDIQKKK